MFITFLLLFAAFRATYFDCFLDIAEGVFLIHAFTQRMGIASPRTTDTGVFIKPTAETGWKEISLLQKRKKRSSPLVELDVFFFDLSELVFQPCSFFLILLAFPKIPASAAAIEAKRTSLP